MPKTALAILILMACLVCASNRVSFAESPATPQQSLAPTPPMGWASWNPFFCDYNEQTIRDQADALVATGMRDLGYRYVLVQECIAPAREPSGELILDPARFPHGMKSLVDYIHSRGLKAGAYTDVGPYTCFPKPHYQGSYGHELQDARTFASWGIDFIEMDYCNRNPEHTGREIYERMAAAIQETGRPMLLYICSWGNESPWTWAQGKAQLWRTDADISYRKNQVDWTHVVAGFKSNALHAVFNAPDSWNDPDMLEVGNGGLNMIEAQTHFSMWAISAVPLWAGTDLTKMSGEVRRIYTNPEVIAVDQDPFGAGPVKATENRVGLEIWSKPLGSMASGTDAVLLLNLTDTAADVALRWSDLNLTGKIRIRDLYSHKDIVSQPEGYRTHLPPHGSAMLKVSGTYMWSKGATFEAEWPGNLRKEDSALLACASCSQGYAISLHGPKDPLNTPSLEFTHVVAPVSGKYQLTLYYVDSHLITDKLQLRVNDGTPIPVHLFSFINGFESLPIMLEKGNNTLTFTYNDAAETSVNIDKIQIYR